MRIIWMVVMSAMVMVGSAMMVAGCGDDGPEVLECEGSCTCEEETRTCACHGGTECAIDGVDDIRFECDGNASCDLSCGRECHVVCPGTTSCAAAIGPQGSAECRGTATCVYDCDEDCEIDCGSNADCTINCDDECESTGSGCEC